MIYFDNNATTPIDERVLEAMLPFLSHYYGNPSSLYKTGRLSRSAIDTAREQVAALVGVSGAQVIFTSGGTEANALALHSSDVQARLAISAIEHSSISATALHLKQQGRVVQTIPVDANGVIQPSAIEALHLKSSDFVSIMLANNETGCLQPIAAHAELLRATGVTIHTDAVQALGKIPLNFNQLGVHLMSLSSHKIYGPKGCGALIVDKNTVIKPLFFGGHQEKGLRSGTENVAACVGFGKAAELALAELEARIQHLFALRLQLERALTDIPEVTIFAKNAARLPNTIQFGTQDWDGEMLLMQLDQKNIAVSSGSACASGGEDLSPVLTAMGIEPLWAKSAIRLSLGIQNTAEECEQFIAAFKMLLLNH